MQIRILASGSSSVGGFYWYFVGLDGTDMMAATRGQDFDPMGPPAGWRVQRYFPGGRPAQWPEIKGPVAEAVIEACRTQMAERSINWTDTKAILDLYWNYKK